MKRFDAANQQVHVARKASRCQSGSVSGASGRSVTD
jgi:hypothetical protein